MGPSSFIIIGITLAVVAGIWYAYGAGFFKSETVDMSADSPPNMLHQTIISKPQLNTTEMEYKIHDLINQQRVANGLQPLGFDTKLAAIARAHSQDMIDRNYFAHTTPDGKTLWDRYKEADHYTCYGIGGENIAKIQLYNFVTYTNNIPTYEWRSQDQLPEISVNDWMQSLGHRTNILDSHWSNEGIGVSLSNDSSYITEDFC